MSEVEILLGSHMDVMIPLLQERASLAGDIAEFGVYAGATTVQLAQFGRTVWAFDTFTGIPADSFTEGMDVDEPGKFVAPLGTFTRLSKFPNIRPIVGRIENVDQLHLHQRWHDAIIVLAYLDCDLYRPTVAALAWLANHLVPGGIIVLDDYATHPGIRAAVGEFLDRWPHARFNGSEVIYW